MYVAALKHKIKKYRIVTYATLISHPCKNYTTLYIIDVGQTFKAIKNYYAFKDSFAKYIKKMEDVAVKVKLVHADLLNDNTLMTFGELSMGKYGLYKKEIDKRNDLLVTEKKNWAKFKETFAKAEARQKHKMRRDERAGGFGHTHAATHNPFANL